MVAQASRDEDPKSETRHRTGQEDILRKYCHGTWRGQCGSPRGCPGFEQWVARAAISLTQRTQEGGQPGVWTVLSLA